MSPSEMNPHGVLTEREILDLNLIVSEDGEKLDERCFGNASFNFRLGDEYCIPGSSDHETVIRKCSDPSSLGIVVVPPFSSAIISTYENVKLPNNVTGRFDLRIEWALAGLIFQVGTQIKPGYEGKLFGMLHNLSDKSISIRYKDTKDRLITAEFHYTSSEAPPKHEKTNLYKIKDFLSKGTVTGSLHGFIENFETRSEKLFSDLEDLKTKYEKDNKVLSKEIADINDLHANIEGHKYKFFSFYLGVTVLVLTIVIPTLVIKWTYDKDDFPVNQIHQLETTLINKIDSINQSKLKSEIDSLKKILNNEVDSKNKSTIKNHKNNITPP